MVAPRTTGTATAADLASLDRSEVIAGEVHEKAAPSAEHGAEPFDAIELAVGELFGDDPAD